MCAPDNIRKLVKALEKAATPNIHVRDLEVFLWDPLLQQLPPFTSQLTRVTSRLTTMIFRATRNSTALPMNSTINPANFRALRTTSRLLWKLQRKHGDFTAYRPRFNDRAVASIALRRIFTEAVRSAGFGSSVRILSKQLFHERYPNAGMAKEPDGAA